MHICLGVKATFGSVGKPTCDPGTWMCVRSHFTLAWHWNVNHSDQVNPQPGPAEAAPPPMCFIRAQITGMGDDIAGCALALVSSIQARSTQGSRAGCQQGTTGAPTHAPRRHCRPGRQSYTPKALHQAQHNTISAESDQNMTEDPVQTASNTIRWCGMISNVMRLLQARCSHVGGPVTGEVGGYPQHAKRS